MKRTILGYLFTAGVILFSFSAVYSIQYNRLKEELDDPRKFSSEADPGSEESSSGPTGESRTQGNVLQGNRPSQSSEDKEENSAGHEHTKSQGSSEAREADAVDEIRTNTSMVYVVGQYDWSTGIVTETVEKFPEEMLDLTRQELLAFLRENPEYGSLLSFSEHAVYLRKADSADWSEYLYFLILEEDGLMVYHLDRTTLYLDTGIMADELSEDNRELLKSGFYIRDTAGLFDYLQTVTS